MLFHLHTSSMGRPPLQSPRRAQGQRTITGCFARALEASPPASGSPIFWLPCHLWESHIFSRLRAHPDVRVRLAATCRSAFDMLERGGPWLLGELHVNTRDTGVWMEAGSQYGIPTRTCRPYTTVHLSERHRRALRLDHAIVSGRPKLPAGLRYDGGIEALCARDGAIRTRALTVVIRRPPKRARGATLHFEMDAV